VAGALISGWLVVSLLGLAVVSGSAFLLGAHIGPRGGMAAAAVGDWLAVSRVVSAGLAGAACAWVWSEAAGLRSRLTAVIMATAVVLALVMPALGAVLLVLALAITTGMRVIALVALAAVIWIVGAFYYNLSMPLTHKAAVLAGCGAVLGAAALVCGGRIGGFGISGRAASETAEAVCGLSPVMQGMLCVAGLAVVGAVSVEAIRGKETLIRDGEPVYVELMPLDPRSLIQGDYMALRFRLPTEALRALPAGNVRMRGIGMRESTGVLAITRVGTAATPLAEGEAMIELVRKGGQWIVVTDAWYFKEGTAAKWAAARYGEFRVLPDGRALLVGLADKNCVAIK
jgi:uncharacterized membrane-anchored protein